MDAAFLNPTTPEPETIQTDAIPTIGGAWFILDYPRPPKGLHANDRAHWRTKAGATADIRHEVMVKTRALGLGELERVRVDVEWVVGTAVRRDVDNLAPFCKAIYDGIGADRGVSAHLVPDDDPAHMVKPAPTIRYEKGVRPHFMVTITDLGGLDRGGAA